MQPTGMTERERRAAFSLAGIYSTRMLGLFMILPVFAIYAEHLEGATPVLVGLAIGIYGLTQAVFQIPFGILSDRIGRKPVIYLALTIFALGSVVAAMADTMIGVVLGRALQGAGAVAAVVMALAADLTSEEHRLKVMAIIGMTIGISFSISLVLGPLMNSWIGVDGIFWFTAVLAVLAMALIKFWVPDPGVSKLHRDTEPVPAQFKEVLKDTQLLRLDFGIFALHMILTATFVAVPLELRDQAGLATSSHWMVYLGVMLVAFLAMVPFIIVAEKKRRMKQVFVIAIAIGMVAQWGLSLLSQSVAGIAVSLFLFFLAFNILEASLPSLVAKMAPPDKKGTAMGIYSSSQFLGAFVGGVAGGAIYGAHGTSAVFIACSVVAALWLFVAATMRNPRYLGSYLINVGEVDEEKARRLVMEMTQVQGVAEVVIVPEDGIAYLKVDNNALDTAALQKFSVNNEQESVAEKDATSETTVAPH